MRRTIAGICRDECGYVAVLALIAMPLMLGLSLLVIDVSRGNNLHTDLQNAVDALALAGARELDGGVDAITRSNTAIATLLNNQARFSDNIDETKASVPVFIDETKVSVVYLDDVPVSDDTSIDATWITAHETADGTEAEYVLVRSNPRAMTSLFPVPVGWTRDTVNIRAEAVATYDVSACDVTPLFICNPFEGDGSGQTFEQSFAAGKTYARQLTLLFNGSTTVGPGNFGWLQVAAPGGSALRDALATGKPGVCYEREGLTTKTGGTIGPAEQGLNTRFGIYGGGGLSDSDPQYRPATNVRRGTKDATKNKSCSSYEEETDGVNAMAFPAVSIPGQGTYGNQTIGGGTVSGEVWDLAAYWAINHPGVALPNPFPTVSDPTGAATVPSRYDVYLYEIAQGLITGPANTAPNGETGDPNRCYKGGAGTLSNEPDRRVIFAAVVNCNSVAFSGQTTFTNPEAFVSMFMSKPMIASGSTKNLSVEVIDVTGYSGNGTLDTFLREESYLVR